MYKCAHSLESKHFHSPNCDICYCCYFPFCFCWKLVCYFIIYEYLRLRLFSVADTRSRASTVLLM